MISKEFISQNHPLRFRCKKCSKEWENSSKSIRYRIRMGNPEMLCPYCNPNESRVPRLSKKDQQKRYEEIAKRRNGKLLSRKFLNVNSNLRWKCNVCNYIWLARPANIKRGTWCPNCAIVEKKKLHYNIQDMQKLAKEKLYGGKCLSNRYKGIYKKLE